MYNTLSLIITDRTCVHLEESGLLPNKQKGRKRASYGSEDQLLVKKVIIEDCNTRKKSQTASWVDYRKTFDSVPHSWIIKTLDLYKVSPEIIMFVEVT